MAKPALIRLAHYRIECLATDSPRLTDANAPGGPAQLAAPFGGSSESKRVSSHGRGLRNYR